MFTASSWLSGFRLKIGSFSGLGFIFVFNIYIAPPQGDLLRGVSRGTIQLSRTLGLTLFFPSIFLLITVLSSESPFSKCYFLCLFLVCLLWLIASTSRNRAIAYAASHHC